MKKKITSAALALTMAASCAVVGSASFNAATTDSKAVSAVANESLSASDGLKSNIQDGVILHCFDWKLSDIKDEIPNIAKAGFTAVQTSPLGKKNNGQSWYWAYLPRYFDIGNELGGATELKALCDEAEKYGVKVIVDVVANHLEGDHSSIDPDLKPSQYWHNTQYSTDKKNIDWTNRWQVTHADIGMADLATEDSFVQKKVVNYLNQLKGLGVDGFRWDAAKHIGLPSEGDSFWSTVTSSTGLYNYGEILAETGGNENQVLQEYNKYISVTDSGYSWNVRVAFKNGTVPDTEGNYTTRGIAANKIVLWGESHDNYSNDDKDGSQTQSQNQIDRAYAVVAARKGSSALYFSRPSSTVKDQITLAKKGSTHFTSSEVAAVNKFHNAAGNAAEYYVNGGSACAVTRQGVGAVVVKGSGSGNVSVANGGGYCPAGTYKDAVSGATFTVTNSTISGSVGSSGIAVLYQSEPDGPSASASPESTTYKTDSMTVTLSYADATSGQYSIDGGAYQSFTNGQKITIGAGAAYGTKTTVSVKASDGKTTSDVVSYTYTKVDPNAVQRIYFDNSSYNWSSVYAYIYADGATTQQMTWPGTAMTKDSATGYYVVDVPAGLENGNVIFTESETATTNRYPADMEPGLQLSGETVLFKNNALSPYPLTPGPVIPTTVPSTTKPTTPAPTTAPVGNVLIGDVNGDGKVSISDATEIQLFSAELKANNISNTTAADVNKDGKVDILDATCIQLYLVDSVSSGNYCGQYTGGPAPTTAPTSQPTTTKPQPTTQPQPTTAPVSGTTVYYQNTSNWSTPYAYFWSDDNKSMTTWPGKAMTSVGNGVYSIELPQDAQYIIFSNNGGSQTSKITLQGFGKIYNAGTWSDYSGGGVTPTPTTPPTTTPVSGSTVTFTNSLNWSGTISCYFWSDSNKTMTSWPGQAMTNAGTNGFGQTLYTFDVPDGAQYIIFTNGSSQTVDIPFSGSAKYYAKDSKSGSGHEVGTWE